MSEQERKVSRMSRYERSLKKALDNATSFRLTDKQNAQVAKDLNEGMDEFRRKEAIMAAGAREELKHITLG